MMVPTSHEMARFRDLLTRRVGWQFDDAREDGLARTLAERAEAAGQSCGAYLDVLLRAPAAGRELSQLARQLTVTETYFLRHVDQFSALLQVALPDRLAAAEGGPVEILSIGCASGEEPYSIAMMVNEQLPLAAQQVVITGADLNPAMLERAQRAQYSAWALRDVAPSLIARWFRSDGNTFTLSEQITRAVRFEPRNLVADDADFWLPGRFDIVFCRNLLMYFTPEQACAAVARIRRAMAPGGYLFLGHAETLRGLSNDFHVCHSHDAFFYRREPGNPVPMARPSAPDRPPAEPVIAGDTSWVDTICRASERIAALTLPQADAAVGMLLKVRAAPDLAPVHDLLARERYAQALEHLDELSPDPHTDLDALLLRAVALSHAGNVDQAEAACRTLLAHDELNAGAHYLLALCREARGDLKAAQEEDEIAAHLDPGFAMPRMHLGLLARRQGDPDTSARELVCAAQLLKHEDAARLLLFGGGFNREALIAMCRAGAARPGDR